MNPASLKEPHEILVLFGALLLLVALFSMADSHRRCALEFIRPLPGINPESAAQP